MGNDSTQPFRLVIVTPVYEDSASAILLLNELGEKFAQSDVQLRIVLVDDGSHTPLADELTLPDPACAWTVEVLRLRCNVGHQRAIAIGTAYVHDQAPCDAMLVMDADGEDQPEDAIRLVQRYRTLDGRRMIFAERTRRSESWIFLILYRFYQVFHWFLTGIRVRVGHFSIVPGRFLPTLATLPAMWNHYAAAIFHSRLPYELLPTRRGIRYTGSSKMNYLSLVMHGLHAISVFSDLVAVRILVAIFALSFGCGGVLAGIWVTRLYAELPMPGWAWYGGTALLLLLVLTLGCFSLVLNLMSQRNSLDFLPIRDYKYFVERVAAITKNHD